ncbi:hypothetical protein [Rhodanobacter lindaniclasticus]|uniref:DUF1440 domain-containing protein n=1 Tax=Rhodanobacter lindaniclasticus TaxID=75310 RepID=A0A4S3KEF0_9GAMM|nr:hypothetical protein [Rhodanobacter lindaniclasticus]THD06913.1 hypothetical protein B1991_11320 [Rhodanobacter lindaniclasticus]
MRALRSSVLSSILCGGLLAGTIDIGAASLINRINPLIILRAIASGVLGPAAFRGGLPVSLLGLVLQWAMSLLIAAIFVMAARRMTGLRERWIVAGLAYGVAVFVVMEFVVVPLSAAMNPQFTVASLLENVLAMLLFGLIVSFFARRLAGAAR